MPWHFFLSTIVGTSLIIISHFARGLRASVRHNNAIYATCSGNSFTGWLPDDIFHFHVKPVTRKLTERQTIDDPSDTRTMQKMSETKTI